MGCPRTLRIRSLAAVAVLLLAACAAPDQVPSTPAEMPSTTSEQAQPLRKALPPTAEQQALNVMVTQQDRLYRAAAPLLMNNAELCRRNARNLLGFVAKTRHSYSSDYVQVAQSLLGLGDQLRVTGLLPGSGAARAGLEPGDLLLTIEGKPLPSGENAEREAATMLAPLMTGRGSVKLGIQRNGVEKTLTVPLTYACAFGIELGNADHPAAYSDGKRTLITRGLLKRLGTDEELAYLIAKEMAHNILGHAAQLRITATTRGIIDNLMRPRPDLSGMSGTAGVRPMPAQLDATADKLAMYLLARAGYSLDGVVPFWRRLAEQLPMQRESGYLALHPATEQRVAAMEKTIREIKSKQAAKKPLMP